MHYETIRTESRFDGQVTDILLGPGPANIVTARLMEELSDAIEKSVDTKATKLIVISGDGKHFSYGASVEEHRASAIREVLPRFHRLVGQMMTCPVPTLARVSGLCLGGGFEVALGCSMIFADVTARFGVPEIKLGVIPPVASVLLPGTTGQSAASRMILGGEMVSAHDALRMGIVAEVAEPDTLDATVDAFIEKSILPKSASSLRFANRAARHAIAMFYWKHIERAEVIYLDELMGTADANEGIEAFIEKREPVWKNE